MNTTLTLATGLLALTAMLTGASDSFGQQAAAASPERTPKPRQVSSAAVTLDKEGAAHLPPMVVPFSRYASPQARKALLKEYALRKSSPAEPENIGELRQMIADQYRPDLERLKAAYPVESVPTPMGGVYTDVITPKDGVSASNKDRVLINLHGGGFLFGGRIIGALESIPIASLGKIKVVAVDYRLGPEHKFPAATEDVAAVYKELLKKYPAQNIGIYGCSAGGLLAAESVAWFQKENLPKPGAIGIFCASAEGWSGGDSGYLSTVLNGETPSANDLAPPHATVDNMVYFSEADFKDPLVAPVRSPAVLAKFPPTLLVTATRDSALSSAVYTHTQLVKLGVDAALHIWEGVGHAFFLDSDLPESREAWDVITKFFDSRLGKSAKQDGSR